MITKPLILLVPPARFERTAPGLGILCSIHLSYGGISSFSAFGPGFQGLGRPQGAPFAGTNN